jgi:hypothetical protein
VTTLKSLTGKLLLESGCPLTKVSEETWTKQRNDISNVLRFTKEEKAAPVFGCNRIKAIST